MFRKLIFLVICLFYFPHFCNAFAGEGEDPNLPPLVAVRKYIPPQHTIRQGDLALKIAQDPQNISDGPVIYLHTVLLSLGKQCLEFSKKIPTCAFEGIINFLPDRYSPVSVDGSHLTLYNNLTKMTSPFPWIKVKENLLLLASSYAEASDKCLPREATLRVVHSEKLKNTILIACADPYEVAAHHEIRPFNFSPDLRANLAPYCLYYKTLYEELVNKESSYTEFLAGLKYLMENAVILRPTPDRHTVFENLPLKSLLEDYIRLKDSWTKRHRAVTEPAKLLAPPSLATLARIDDNYETTVHSEINMLKEQVSILQAINTQLKECVTTYQTKLDSLTLHGSTLPATTTAVLSANSTAKVIEKVRAFIEKNASFFVEIYHERIMRLCSLTGTLKATQNPLTIPNIQNVMLKGAHFDPTSLVKAGKRLKQIRDGFRLLAHDLKEHEVTSVPETSPLPRASKSNSTTLFWRQKHTPTKHRLGSSSTPSISHSISTITGSSIDSSEDEVTLFLPQGSPTPTTSSSNSQGTP
ncbi:MAG: hypothetical protein K2X28_08200 [Alphaproteobacteria bacterium]|nr:hypothetical protein [Alphaproteobacteria bacterium]